MRNYLQKSTILIVLSLMITNVFGRSGKPNIVLIFADDLGWTGLSCYGSQYYETPNIDKLCNEGMKFTQGYAAACVCAPSRAALISGQYSPANGTLRVTNVPNRDNNHYLYKSLQPDNLPFSENIVTIAEALKKGSYKTAMFGKWHLSPGMPGDHGFDTWIESSGRHFDFKTSSDIKVKKGTYLTDFMCDHAIKFIKSNKNNPFFLYLPDFLVHKPHEAKQELINKYKGKKSYRGQGSPVYAAMTESLDVTVGLIYKTLDSLNLLENTLIIFTSDNGAMSRTDANGAPSANSYTDNLPLRDGKGLMYEGGLRVPYIFYWKGKIQAGSVCEEPITGIDLYPTFLEVAEVEKPLNYELHGVSIAKCLYDHQFKLEKRSLFWHYPNYGPASVEKGKVKYAYIPTDVVLYGDYKLLEFYQDKTERVELYNLKNDIAEQNDLSSKMPGKTARMLKILNDWRGKIKARMPVPNPDFKNEKLKIIHQIY